MLTSMIVLAAVGIGLLVTAPLIARGVMRGGRDPVALTRILQAIGAVLVVAALLSAPYNRETTAVPPPPDVPDEAIGR